MEQEMETAWIVGVGEGTSYEKEGGGAIRILAALQVRVIKNQIALQEKQSARTYNVLMMG